MLNYIWAALIVLSFGFALWTDVDEFSSDRYRNGEALPVQVESIESLVSAQGQTFAGDSSDLAITVPATFAVSRKAYADFYGVELPGEADLEMPGRVIVTKDGVEARLNKPAVTGWPEPLATILPFSKTRDGELLAEVSALDAETGEALWTQDLDPDDERSLVDIQRAAAVSALGGAEGTSVGLEFGKVRFRKLSDIAQAAFDMADTAFEIALGLVGVLCLWLGLVKIAEDAGLVYALVKVVRPLLGLIFPELPKDHPALGMIALNLAANMLGLGNAATPMGLKAMEEMQKLNPTDETATNSMCMFLAVNTASVQLVPPATLVAIMGVSTGQLWLPILIVTGLSLAIAIATAKALSLAPVFRGSDPMKQRKPEQATPPEGTP